MGTTLKTKVKIETFMKKVISSTIITVLLAFVSLIYFEPELARAFDIGVSLQVTTEITLDCDAACDMTTGGPINAISGGSLTGNFACTVKTPDTTGWNLTVKKNQTLQRSGGGANKEFTDYTENSPLDYTWTAPGAGNETFGFNLRAATEDAVAKYTDNGSDTCGAGTVSNDHCWTKFPTTPTTEKVSSSNAATDPAGDPVNFGLKAEAGGSNFLEPGAYATTITATATIGP